MPLGYMFFLESMSSFVSRAIAYDGRMVSPHFFVD